MPWDSDAPDKEASLRLRLLESEELPLHFVRPFKEKPGTLKALNKELRQLSRKRQAQQIFLLIGINLTGTILLLVCCRLSSSIALLAYTYLSWFNFLSLLTCLLCVWAESQVANYSFTFGLLRSEVLAVFASAMLTLLGALFILKEAIERLLIPEEINGELLIWMSSFGLLFNLGMMIMTENHPLRHVLKASPSSLLQEHFSDMCLSLCIHFPRLKHILLPRLNPLFLIFIIGFVFIGFDHVIVEIYQYKWGDPFAAILIAAFTVITMLPLCTCSANLLLQTVPHHLFPHLDKRMREASTLDGVVEVRHENFWVMGILDEGGGGSGRGCVLFGSLHVRVRRDANEQLVVRHISDKLKPFVSKLTIQVFKDDWKQCSTTLQLLNESSLTKKFSTTEQKKSLHSNLPSSFANANYATANSYFNSPPTTSDKWKDEHHVYANGGAVPCEQSGTAFSSSGHSQLLPSGLLNGAAVGNYDGKSFLSNPDLGHSRVNIPSRDFLDQKVANFSTPKTLSLSR